MSLEKLKKGVEKFQKEDFEKYEERFNKLIEKGQKPKILFIGCADSRVVPELFTKSKPGELFIVRNVGAFVPPFKPDQDFHGTAAGIEYAVFVLNVSHIVVCGHSHCGAIESLFETIDKPELIHVKKWLELGERAKNNVLQENSSKNISKEEILRQTERESIVTQIENLLTYPDVAKKIKEKKLEIVGWYYKIESGEIECYDPIKDLFLPL